MGRYKEKTKNESPLPFGIGSPTGDRLHTSEIKDTGTGETGKGTAWDAGKAHDKAWKDLKKK